METQREEELLTVEETAEHLKVTVTSVRRYLSDGLLAYGQIGGKHGPIRIRKSDVVALVAPKREEKT